MTYTTLAQLSSLTDKEVVEAVPALIDFVKDPETKVSQNNGKPYTEQSLKLKGSDGTECWATIYEPKLFMDRSAKGKKAVFCSTVRDGKMQGVQVGIWNGKVSLRISGSANVTFPDGAPVASQGTAEEAKPQQQQQSSQPQQQYAKAAPVNGLHHLAALWTECYHAALPVCGEAYAVQAAATLFIEANKRNIGPTLTQPHAAIAALAPSARKIADAVIAKGGYDADKLPDGEELDAVVDLLIDKAAESISRERLGVAYDAFVAGYPHGKQAAVKAMVSSWEVFLGGVK
jgi:hypothetical protein